jgi:hypothetical protein
VLPLSPLSPFVGRAAEVALLRAAFADAAALHPRIVQIEERIERKVKNRKIKKAYEG